MVSKKTANSERKVAELKPADKKVEAKPAAKKATVKKEPAAKKKVAEVKKEAVVKKEPVEKKVVTVSTAPVTENKDVVGSVLEIKAKNDSKKAKKAAAKKQEAVTPVVEKGAKASSQKVKRDAVKVKAQKAEAQKFIALKEEKALKTTQCKPCCSLVCGMVQALKAWARGYKNIFNYKGRTSRYDYWAFMLINLILSFMVVIPFQMYNFSVFVGERVASSAVIYSYWVFIVVEMLVYLSLTVRRLHDTGANGWNGFFRPMTYTILGAIVLAVIAGSMFTEAKGESALEFVFGFGFVILMLMNLYYLLKTFIAAGFMEEERNENAYGVPTFVDDCCKAKILRYSALYFLIFTFYMAVMLSVQYYISMALLLGGSIQ